MIPAAGCSGSPNETREGMTPHVNARSVVLPAFVLCFLAQDPIALNAQATGPETARAYREANEAAILREYAEFLAVPNVASDSVGIWRNAEIIRDALLARGVDSRLLTVPGAPPVVFGQLMVPGATRTLGIYVHYDGQPADPANWTFPPWEPTLLDGDLAAGARAMEFPAPGEKVDPEWRLYARSAGDERQRRRHGRRRPSSSGSGDWRTA